MRCALVGLLILLFSAVAGAETLPPPPAATADLARTLALLDEVDPQTLPVDQRRTLYFVLSDALLADGQQERALTFLAQAALTPLPATVLQTDQPIRVRLEKIASPVLLAALNAGSSLAPLLQAELRRRGEPLPELLAGGERVVGVLLPLSGQGAPFGQAVQRGLEAARAAAATQSPARFLYRDTAADAAALPRLVEELAARPEVLAIIGPLLSSDAATAAALAEQRQIPLLMLAPRDGATGGYVFRNALTVAAQLRVLAEFASREQLRRVAVLYPATRHGEFCADQFRTEVESRGGQLVARQSYPAGAVDLRQPLEALAKEANRRGGPPDALFIPDRAQQVAQIIPQLGFSRLDQLQLLGTNDWHDPDLGRMAGPLSEGAVLVAGFFAASPWPEISDFVARFQAAYGLEPNILSAQGYDAGRIMTTLLARPELADREALRRAISDLRDFPGVTGRTRFSPNGEADKALFLLQVQDGTLVQIN